MDFILYFTSVLCFGIKGVLLEASYLWRLWFHAQWGYGVWAYQDLGAAEEAAPSHTAQGWADTGF